jgi:hypothetical protein
VTGAEQAVRIKTIIPARPDYLSIGQKIQVTSNSVLNLTQIPVFNSMGIFIVWGAK